MSISQPKITIWDSDGECSAHGAIILWNGFDDSGNGSIVSIQKYIENHSDILRQSYNAFIYDLGNRLLGKQCIVDHLKIRDQFSYWWMSLVTEKCNFAKSPQIDDAIKLLALEGFLNQYKVEKIELVTTNITLVEVFQEWCDKNGVGFICMQQAQPSSMKFSLKSLYMRIPKRVQAFIWLFHRLLSHWYLHGVGIAQWRQSNAKTTFVSYLFNMVPSKTQLDKFESRYWGDLPDSLVRDGQPTRWLHIWVKDKVAPSAKVAKQLVERFNRTTDARQVHVTLDSFLSSRTAWNTLIDWVRLQWRARKLESALSITGRKSFNLWPLLRDDWRDSIRGTTAMSNLLMLNLFEAAFAGIPKQKQGCYLQENQGWEFGCISAWKNAGHQNLIGVPHSTIRYWDLRYFFDYRNYHQTGTYDLPLPSKIAVNGPVAKDTYLQGGYPSDQLVEVEALRYLYLDDQDNTNTSTVSIDGKNRLLVLGDYLPENTAQQLEILEKLADKLDDWVIVIKPHPASPIVLGNYPRLSSINTYITDLPINKLLPDFDVAYTSLTTSAAVDAYCAGLSVISALGPSTLNLSPLLGVDGVQFVSHSKELIVALKKTDHQTESKQYFYLDSEFPRWKSLLEITE